MEPHRVFDLVFFPITQRAKKSHGAGFQMWLCTHAVAHSYGSMFILAAEVDVGISLHKNLSCTIAVQEVTPLFYVRITYKYTYFKVGFFKILILSLYVVFIY